MAAHTVKWPPGKRERLRGLQHAAELEQQSSWFPCLNWGRNEQGFLFGSGAAYGAFPAGHKRFLNQSHHGLNCASDGHPSSSTAAGKGGAAPATVSSPRGVAHVGEVVRLEEGSGVQLFYSRNASVGGRRRRSRRRLSFGGHGRRRSSIHASWVPKPLGIAAAARRRKQSETAYTATASSGCVSPNDGTHADYVNPDASISRSTTGEKAASDERVWEAQRHGAPGTSISSETLASENATENGEAGLPMFLKEAGLGEVTNAYVGLGSTSKANGTSTTVSVSTENLSGIQENTTDTTISPGTPSNSVGDDGQWQQIASGGAQIHGKDASSRCIGVARRSACSSRSSYYTPRSQGSEEMLSLYSAGSGTPLQGPNQGERGVNIN